MRFLLAVILVSLAVLFLLTALALGATRQLQHPLRVSLALTAPLALGLILLSE
jgi:hypothetical protein